MRTTEISATKWEGNYCKLFSYLIVREGNPAMTLDNLQCRALAEALVIDPKY